ncbi:elongation factor Ts, mitochondrial [Aristolochia californica]|uniref:elongation factor Ts, mitochondrial n=1 Tax=Aristolochia californica TaxID=171875 RepID=UPI0035E2F0E2
MAFAQAAKRPIAVLLKRTNAYRQFGHSYSAGAFIGQQAPEGRDSRNYFCCSHCQSPSGGLLLLRRFSSELPATQQVNLIKQLRERTSAPMKDVKAALVACKWDIEEAQKDLRKRGVVLASKKFSRTAAEGFLALAQNEKKAAVIELNCETDFVARNEVFQYLAVSLAKTALSIECGQQGSMGSVIGPEHLQDLKITLDHPKLYGDTTVQNAVTEVAGMMGENVKFRRGFALSTSSHGVVSTYLHSSPQPGLGRMAGILTLETKHDNVPLDDLQQLGSSLAMHIVAARPQFLSKELVSSEAIENERDILKTQAERSGKTQIAMEKMVEGRLRKYFEEVVLLEQKFIVNESVIVKSLLNDLSKEVGSTVQIGKFLRIEVGEGIQKDVAATVPEAVVQAA